MIYHKNCLLIKGGRGFEDLNSLLRYLIFHAALIATTHENQLFNKW